MKRTPVAAYYNEIDPFAAEWLRELIRAGLIADGIVDTRSVEDVRPDDLADFTQCHFFAGIGVWSYALRRAGWPDDRPIWTGSCPCQPFSSAGKGDGFADERHLWPAFYHLIRERRPAIVAGEQVASKDADPWIDLVQADLEAVGYRVGAIAFPSAGVGAPHIRDRTYWLGHTDQPRLEGLGRGHQAEGGRVGAAGSTAAAGELVRLADPYLERRDGVDSLLRGNPAGRREGNTLEATGRGEALGLADASGQRRQQDARSASGDEEAHGRAGRHRRQSDGDHVATGLGEVSGARSTGPVNGHWRDADWLLCRDGKWRPVEPGTFPLAHGAPARVGRLRGYGNAINAEAARTFIEAFAEVIDNALDLI